MTDDTRHLLEYVEDNTASDRTYPYNPLNYVPGYYQEGRINVWLRYKPREPILPEEETV